MSNICIQIVEKTKYLLNNSKLYEMHEDLYFSFYKEYI